MFFLPEANEINIWLLLSLFCYITIIISSYRIFLNAASCAIRQCVTWREIQNFSCLYWLSHHCRLWGLASNHLRPSRVLSAYIVTVIDAQSHDHLTFLCNCLMTTKWGLLTLNKKIIVLYCMRRSLQGSYCHSMSSVTDHIWACTPFLHFL